MASLIRTWFRAAAAILLIPPSLGLATSSPKGAVFETVAEKTDYLETGRLDEVDAWARALKKKYPTLIRTIELGESPEGRPLRAYAVGNESAGGRLPVVLFIGGIHAGEIDGKDAGMIFLRDLLGSPKASVLKKVTVLFLPVFNIDGFARFGAHHRPNQIGPKETGWRVTSQNLNLNRDFLKAQAPEMRQLLRLVRDWDPLVTADLHVTNGADFQYDVGIVVQPRREVTSLAPAGQTLSEGVLKHLSEGGFLGLPFYPSFLNDTPESGIEDDWASPRYSQGYFSARNRIGILVETHSWKTFGRRVKATIRILESIVDLTATHGAQWKSVAEAQDAQKPSEEPQPLSYEVGPEKTIFDFAGYQYQRVISPISGKNEIEYNPKVKQIWKVPLQLSLKPQLLVAPPKGGYVIAAGSAGPIEDVLKAHGIKYSKINRPREQLEAQVFRVGEFQISPKSVEGRQTVKISGQWHAENVNVPSGSLWVPSAQPKLRLAMSLLEPLAPDSLASWGFFNAFLERREYMEPYVAHSEGLRMLENDPALKAEFQSLLKTDPTFSNDSEARLDFIYLRHPAFDRVWKRLPVFRVEANKFGL